MARFLTTLPENLGFYNLGTVQSYPTGGTGPTGYGPTGIFGSDPLPSTPGDSLYNPIDLGDFSSALRAVTITNSHGGLSRRQSTFYTITLYKARSVQFTQNYSQFAYTSNTNRNTLLAFYKITDGTKRVELPINNNGYVYSSTGIDDTEQSTRLDDYPSIKLDPGRYSFVITNDIRYQETTYSITVGIALTDWRFVAEAIEENLDFGSVTTGAETTINFGSLAT